MGKFTAIMALFRVVSAEPSAAIDRITRTGVILYDIDYQDELTVHFSVKGRDMKAVRQLLEGMDVSWKVLNRSDSSGFGRRLGNRPVLVVGLLLLIFLSLMLPTRIFFIRVSGNTSVPSEMIRITAEECGICFGASAREVRSEKVKNRLLEAIPDLQWVGVNTRGCVATIQVEEKSTAEETQEQSNTVSSIVAAHDGIIESYTVTSGNPLCQVGQAVKAGQVLVSGYTDCGIILKATLAKAEIYAQTLHDISVVSPAECTVLGKEVGRQVCYSIKIGKKLINFDKGSGIPQGTCVKMYEESYMTLPGNFSLPVVLLKETRIYYETQSAEAPVSQELLEQQAADYLLQQMIAGKILSSELRFTAGQSTATVTGRFLCSEMIGRTRYEQWIQGDTEN